MSELTPARPDRRGLLLLAGCLGLFLLLRLAWRGHLLVWDEAMTVCTLRFRLGSFSDWFWRRPPLYSVLLMLVHPLQAGFVGRAELVSIGISAAGLLALFGLNRRVFGAEVALWSCFALAVMPGAMLFDVWLKQDGLAGLFGLLAIWLFVEKRYAISALCLGLGALSKELIVFYGLAIAVLWILHPKGERSLRQVALLAVIPLLVAGWWYVWFSNSVGKVLSFVSDAGGVETAGWARPWYYFLQKTPLDLGWHGVALTFVGIAALVRAGMRRRWDAAVWPLALLLSAYAVLMAVKGKTPWFTAILLPAFATLEAAGLQALVDSARRVGPRFASRAVAVVVAAVFAIVASGRDYEEDLKRQDYPFWWGAQASREAALTLNGLVTGEERALITSMYYWATPREVACPIFVCYLKDIPHVVRKGGIRFDAVTNDVRKYNLDWVMLSPDPDTAEEAILEPFRKTFGLSPITLSGSYIFHTTAIWTNAPAGK